MGTGRVSRNATSYQVPLCRRISYAADTAVGRYFAIGRQGTLGLGGRAADAAAVDTAVRRAQQHIQYIKHDDRHQDDDDDENLMMR